MASITFPSSPSNGDTYTYDGLVYEYNSAKNKWSVKSTTTLGGLSADAVGESLVPTANVTYDLGTADKAFRDLYLSGSSINLGGQSITASESGIVLPEGSTVGNIALGAGGATQYANTASLPKQDLTAGQFAFVGNTLFMTNGTGWYSVALINQSPSLTLSTSSISLGLSSNTINFTFTATDPDGLTPTVTAELIGANTTQANVTVYASNSTVTVENLSATDYSANIVLTATDGIDQTFGTVTLTVSYLSALWDETVLSIGTSSTNSLNNSTFIDRSTNAHTVTTTGTPVQTAFHPYLDNWSVDFDGSGDALRISDDASIQLGTGQFTIEFWFYARSTGGVKGLVAKRDSVTNYWRFIINSGSLDFRRYTSFNTTSVSVVSNRMYHVAVTRDSSNNVRFFVNGVLESTGTDTGNYAIPGSTLRIGEYEENVGSFDGYISNVRIVKGDALYTSAFTPPTEKLTAVPGTSLLTCQSNRFIDNSTNAHTITPAGDAKVSAYNPFGQGSEYAVGENKGSTYIEVNQGIVTTTPSGLSGDMTIEGWWYLKETSTSAYIFDLQSPRLSLFYEWTGGGSGQDYSFDAYDTGYKTFSSGSNVHPVQLNQWNHLAYVRSSGTWSLYINGVQTDATISNSNDFSSTGFSISQPHPSRNQGASLIDNYFSDVKITPSAVYTTNFTPPTSPVGNTNASLYLPMDNAGIYDKTGNYNLTLVNQVSTSTTETKFADTSMSFDGIGDYIEFDPESANFGTRDFTIEMWINANSHGNNGLFRKYDTEDSASPGSISVYMNSTTIYLGVNTGTTTGTWYTAGNPVVDGQWHHLAITRSSGTVKLFIDGSAIITETGNTADVDNTTTFRLGQWRNANLPNGGYNWNGYIENFQILKGVAKYTTNFTPPTQEQGRAYQAEL
jgi:hypothetical protein